MILKNSLSFKSVGSFFSSSTHTAKNTCPNRKIFSVLIRIVIILLLFSKLSFILHHGKSKSFPEWSEAL